MHSAEEDNLSPFDSNIACLCQSIEINNNKYVYVYVYVYNNLSYLHKISITFETHFLVMRKQTRTPIGNMVLALIPACVSNYVYYKVWDEITYPFLNFNGCTVEV